MKREIKLRIWDSGDSKMKYADMEHFDDMIGFRFEHKSPAADIGLAPIEIMQFTGMRCIKSGAEIYERDICKTDTGFIGVVEWDNDYAGWVIDDKKDDGEDGDYETLEKIGNVYEHPELLTQQSINNEK